MGKMSTVSATDTEMSPNPNQKRFWFAVKLWFQELVPDGAAHESEKSACRFIEIKVVT